MLFISRNGKEFKISLNQICKVSLKVSFKTFMHGFVPYFSNRQGQTLGNLYLGYKLPRNWVLLILYLSACIL